MSHLPPPRRGPRSRALLPPLLVLLIALSAPGLAQEAGRAEPTRPEAWTGDRYELPPESVQRIFEVDKNIPSLQHASPDGRRFLVPLDSELSTLERMARPTLRLAMLELRGGVGRTWHLDTFGIHGLRIYELESRSWRDVELPEGLLVSDMLFSPDGESVAFLAHEQGEPSRIWVADATTGAARRLADAPVLATLATGAQSTSPSYSSILQWTPRGTLVTLLVPEDRGPEPQRGVPAGPIIRTTRDDPTPNPTWPFLLQDAHEAELFRYHTTSEIAEVDADGQVRRLGEPGMFASLSVSPDGAWVLAERVVEPLSPITAAYGFGRDLEVIALGDGSVAATVRERPLREGRARDDEDPDRDLPREVTWVPGRDATLAWLQRQSPEAADEDDGEGDESQEPAADGGEKEDDAVDRILLLEPPFETGGPRELVHTEDELSDLLFGADGDHALAWVTRQDDDRRTLVVWDATVDAPGGTELLPYHDPEEVLELPGEPLVDRTANGLPRAVLDGDEAVYLQGEGWREDFRPRPFVDRQPLDGGDAVRLFQGAADRYERPLLVLDDDLGRMIVSRESPTRVPDSYLWTRTGDGTPVPRDEPAGDATDTGEAADGGGAAPEERAGAPADWENLTANRDPFPEITAAERMHFSFTRRDGLEIHGRISMPVGWQEGQRVPAIFWTYPTEYRTEEDYRRDALTDWNRNRFNPLSYLRWSEIWLTRGYALVWPDVPIVGDPYNDNYVSHLRDSLYAALREVDRRGWVDVDRVGHGGHSYGAFATANLLARTPFFKAGIAGNGAYNRTLTPMGFQREPRFVWEARDTYLEMSPFFAADHIDTPLLMYHGADDDNTGTWPMQSRRMIQALTGLGKEAVLYLYPYESHSPRARATYLDLWARWLDFFDTHVKGGDE